MSIRSYLVLARDGTSGDVRSRIEELPGCEVLPAANRSVLLLVTETGTSEQADELRARIEGLEGVGGLVLTFGAVDPDTDEPDPLRRSRVGKRLTSAVHLP